MNAESQTGHLVRKDRTPLQDNPTQPKSGISNAGNTQTTPSRVKGPNRRPTTTRPPNSTDKGKEKVKYGTSRRQQSPYKGFPSNDKTQSVSTGMVSTEATSPIVPAPPSNITDNASSSESDDASARIINNTLPVTPDGSDSSDLEETSSTGAAVELDHESSKPPPRYHAQQMVWGFGPSYRRQRYIAPSSDSPNYDENMLQELKSLLPKWAHFSKTQTCGHPHAAVIRDVFRDQALHCVFKYAVAPLVAKGVGPRSIHIVDVGGRTTNWANIKDMERFRVVNCEQMPATNGIEMCSHKVQVCPHVVSDSSKTIVTMSSFALFYLTVEEFAKLLIDSSEYHVATINDVSKRTLSSIDSADLGEAAGTYIDPNCELILDKHAGETDDLVKVYACMNDKVYIHAYNDWMFEEQQLVTVGGVVYLLTARVLRQVGNNYIMLYHIQKHDSDKPVSQNWLSRGFYWHLTAQKGAEKVRAHVERTLAGTDYSKNTVFATVVRSVTSLARVEPSVDKWLETVTRNNALTKVVDRYVHENLKNEAEVRSINVEGNRSSGSYFNEKIAEANELKYAVDPCGMIACLFSAVGSLATMLMVMILYQLFWVCHEYETDNYAFDLLNPSFSGLWDTLTHNTVAHWNNYTGSCLGFTQIVINFKYLLLAWLLATIVFLVAKRVFRRRLVKDVTNLSYWFTGHSKSPFNMRTLTMLVFFNIMNYVVYYDHFYAYYIIAFDTVLFIVYWAYAYSITKVTGVRLNLLGLVVQKLGISTNTSQSTITHSRYCIPFVCRPKQLEKVAPGCSFRFITNFVTEPSVYHACQDDGCNFETWPSKCVLHGYGTITHLPVYPIDCCHNLEAAVRNRSIFDPLALLNKHLVELGHCPKTRLLSWTAFVPPVSPVLRGFDGWCELTVEDWLLRYPTRKQKAYLRELARDQTESTKYMRVGNAKSFIKREPAVGKCPFNPRLIQGSTAAHNVAVGPTIVGLSIAFAHNFDYLHPRYFYATKTSAAQIGQWFHRQVSNGMQFYCNDYSNFDGSLSSSAIFHELESYRRVGVRHEVLSSLKQQLEFDGVASCAYRIAGTKVDVAAKYHSIGRRRSGAPNTSIGNTFLNFEIVTHFMCCNYPEVRYACMALGDDLVIAVDKPICGRKFTDFVAEVGLMAKFESTEPDNVEFCSGLFYPVAGTYVLGPKIGRILSRTFWEKNNLDAQSGTVWAHGVAHCLRSSYSHVPVLNELLHNMVDQYEPIVAAYRSSKLRFTKVDQLLEQFDLDQEYNLRSFTQETMFPSEFYTDARGQLVRRPGRADPETFAYLMRRYDLTVAELSTTMQEMLTITLPHLHVPNGVQTSVVQRFCDVDTNATQDLWVDKLSKQIKLRSVKTMDHTGLVVKCVGPIAEELACHVYPQLRLAIVLVECFVHGSMMSGRTSAIIAMVLLRCLSHMMLQLVNNDGVLIAVAVHLFINFLLSLAPDKTYIAQLNIYHMYDWIKIKNKSQTKSQQKGRESEDGGARAPTNGEAYRKPTQTIIETNKNGKVKLVRPIRRRRGAGGNLVERRMGRGRTDRNILGRSGPVGRLRQGTGPVFSASPVKHAVAQASSQTRNKPKQTPNQAPRKQASALVSPLVRRGVQVGVLHEHDDVSSYQKASNGIFRNVPAAIGVDIPKTESHALRRGSSTMLTISQLLINLVAPSTSTTNQGEVIAVVPVMPSTLGGLISVLSAQYEQCKIKRMHISFLPQQPTSKAGSIAVGCLTDIGSIVFIPAADTFGRLSTTDGFHGTPIWDPASWDLPVQHFSKTVFDEISGDLRFSAEGVIQVVASGEIDGSGSNIGLGSLYLSLEAEFTGPALAPVMDLPPLITSFEFASGSTFNPAAGDPVLALSKATPGASDFVFRFSDDTLPIAGKVYALWPALFGGTAGTSLMASMTRATEPTHVGGSCLYAVVVVGDGGLAVVAFFDNLSSINDLPVTITSGGPTVNEEASPTGVLVWSSDPAVSTTWDFYGLEIDIDSMV